MISPLSALLTWYTFASLTLSSGAKKGPFDPRSYPESNAQCKAIDRSSDQGDQETSININYVEVKPTGKPKGAIIMVHGWPGLWSTWARQIEEFQDEYHLLIPNLRGFGKSTHPGDVFSSGTYSDFVSDLICVLDEAKIDNAICMGHDWGSQICFEAARQRPDRIHVVVGVVVPYLPSAGQYIPTVYLSKLAPKLAYQVYFSSHTDAAVAELDKDIRRSLRAIIRSKDNPPPKEFLLSTESILTPYDGKELEPIIHFSPVEEDYFIEQFEIQGFGKTIQFYLDGNRRRSHAFCTSQGNHTVPVPVLMILPTRDSVANWRDGMKLVGSEAFLPHLTAVDIETSHWPQLESPDEFNTHVREFLDSLPRARQGEKPAPLGNGRDEL